MTALVCPDCGDRVEYRSSQQPNTDAVAELALWAHQRNVHEVPTTLDPDLLGRAFDQIRDTRETRP